jgi:hypothetical protein
MLLPERQGAARDRGWFRKGPDPRRARFTSEQARAAGPKPTCYRLTLEHRRMGGRAAWARMMAEVRLSMGLDLPTEEVRAAARKLLARGQAAGSMSQVHPRYRTA